MSLDLRLYASAVARALKMPEAEALSRLKVVFDDPELLAALHEATEQVGKSTLVTNVQRVTDANGETTFEVSVTAAARGTYERGTKPPTLVGRIEVVNHRIDDWKKYGHATTEMRTDVARYEILRARHGEHARTALSEFMSKGYVDALVFRPIPE